RWLACRCTALALLLGTHVCRRGGVHAGLGSAFRPSAKRAGVAGARIGNAPRPLGPAASGVKHPVLLDTRRRTAVSRDGPSGFRREPDQVPAAVVPILHRFDANMDDAEARIVGT